jgi:membrane protein insertase Oxa1/YidC/SpoIIIJ
VECRYLPFAALLVMIWFPSGLNLYWSCLAACQTVLTIAINNPTMRAYYGIGKEKVVQEKIIKAFIVEKPRKL